LRFPGVFSIAMGMLYPAHGGAQAPAGPRMVLESAWVVPAEGGAGERLVIGPRPEGPAERLYTLRFRHEGEAPLAVLQLVHPLPAGEEYVPHSATGPRAEISYSVDGGRTFGGPDALRRPAAHDDPAQSAERAATPADYSHIRWEIPGPHPPGLAGLVSFRTRSAPVPPVEDAP
jgi:hypothetical protein